QGCPTTSGLRSARTVEGGCSRTRAHDGIRGPLTGFDPSAPRCRENQAITDAWGNGLPAESNPFRSVASRQAIRSLPNTNPFNRTSVVSTGPLNTVVPSSMVSAKQPNARVPPRDVIVVSTRPGPLEVILNSTALIM